MKLEKISILTICNSKFLGHSLSILGFNYSTRKSPLAVVAKSFFYIGVSSRGFNSLVLSVVALGFVIIRCYIRPQKVRICKKCGSLVGVDHDREGYWCGECCSDINEVDTKIVERKPKI